VKVKLLKERGGHSPGTVVDLGWEMAREWIGTEVAEEYVAAPDPPPKPTVAPRGEKKSVQQPADAGFVVEEDE